MTAQQYARSKGYTLKEIAERCYQPTRTISRWHKAKPYVFELLIEGLILRDTLEKVLSPECDHSARLDAEMKDRLIRYGKR